MKPTILQEIFETKRRRIEQRRRDNDFSELVDRAMLRRRDADSFRLYDALSTDGVNIISEIKRASPSKGVIKDGINGAELAMAYERGGAKAISVLTEEDYFSGSFADLLLVRESVSLPILQKDFIFDEFQIYEAAAFGADAILLIAAMLDDDTLVHLHEVAEENLGLDALVEVHNEAELRRAESLGADLIGVNNRDLHTFEVSLDVSRKLISSLHVTGTTMVAESGLRTRDEIIELKGLGFKGFLIGETFMRSADPESELRELTSND